MRLFVIWGLLVLGGTFLAGECRAGKLRGIGTLRIPDGLVSDAARDDGGSLYFCYPQDGVIEQYGSDLKASRSIRREGGLERVFRPVACCAAGGSGILVFDEISRELLEIKPDGNQWSSHPLAFPGSGGSLALSRVGQIDSRGSWLWVLLSDRGIVGRFNADGLLMESKSLGADLPSPVGPVSRIQWDDAGTMYILDYSAGSVYYRSGEGDYHRLRLASATSGVAMPQVQDFSVNSSGEILLLNSDGSGSAALLQRQSGGGFKSFAETLPVGLANRRLGCKAAGSEFIVWSRDGGIVWLCNVE